MVAILVVLADGIYFQNQTSKHRELARHYLISGRNVYNFHVGGESSTKGKHNKVSLTLYTCMIDTDKITAAGVYCLCVHSISL